MRRRALACPFAARAGGIEERLQEYAITLCARAEADGGDVDGAVLRLIEASSVRPSSARLIDTLRGVLPSGSYGCSFSPNSRLLYTAGDLSLPANSQPIYQYDVFAANPAASVFTVTNSLVTSGFDFVSLQLGPNGKLQPARGVQSW